MNALVKYFDLGFRRHLVQLGTSSDTDSQGALPMRSDDAEKDHSTPLFELDAKATVALYVAVLLGALAKNIMDFLSSNPASAFDWRLVLISLILSAVGFPRIFEDRLAKITSTTLRYFIAFESGFFIDAVIRTVGDFYQQV